MTRLNRSLDDLASRGEPRGALDVFAAANTETPTARPVVQPRTRPWIAFAGAFGVVILVGVLIASLLPGGEPDPRTPTGSSVPEPTTTLFVPPPDLPPGSQTPTTVPAGAELVWFDFIEGMVQLAWRETEDGFEMCWKTVVDTGCGEEPQVPAALVISTQYNMLALSRLTDGKAPERVRVMLSNGTSVETSLFPAFGFETMLSGFVPTIPAGVTVVSATTGDWPAPVCVTPPSDQQGTAASEIEISVDPTVARAGDIVDLTLAGSGITGVAALWQCWNGAAWIDTHVLYKGIRGGPASTVRVADGVGWGSIGISIPDTFQIVIPDLPPGIYRIYDRAEGSDGWVIIEIVEPRPRSAGVPTMAPSSRVIEVVDVRLDPSYRQELFVSAGPATLILANGEDLFMPAGTPLPASCDLLDPPDQVSERPCYGAVALAEDGRTVLAFLVFSTERIEPGYPEQTLVLTERLDLLDGIAIIDYGITLVLAPEYSVLCTSTPEGSGPGRSIEVDGQGRVIRIHCSERIDW